MLDGKRPLAAWELRAAAESIRDAEPMPDGKKKALLGWLNKTLGNNTNRKLALGYLFSPSLSDFQMVSSKNMTDAQWLVISILLDTFQDEESGEWYCHPAWGTEALQLMAASKAVWFNNHTDPPDELAWKGVPFPGQTEALPELPETPKPKAKLPMLKGVAI